MKRIVTIITTMLLFMFLIINVNTFADVKNESAKTIRVGS